MGAKQSREMKLALALIRKGTKPAIAAKRHNLRASSVYRAMHNAGITVRKPGRPKYSYTVRKIEHTGVGEYVAHLTEKKKS